MMESSILKQITRFLQEQKKHKRWAVVFVCLAVIVGFGTVTALKMMGQAMTHKEKRLICQYQVHQHEEGCYDAEQKVICGYADYVVHKHNDDCYKEDGTLACTLPELEEHEHTDECWSEEQTVVCGLEESAGHVHTEECYTQQTGGEPTCELEEHQHTEECNDEEGNLICGLEEHQHAETCYPVEEVLTCTVPEGEGAHTHTEECFEVQKTLVCEKPEVRLHTHTDECYEKIDPEQEYSEENRRLICEQLQVEEHVHTEDGGCLEIVEVTAVGEPVEDMPAEATEVFTTDLDGENEETETEDAKDGEDAKDAEDGDEDSEEAKDEETKDAKTYELTKTYTGDGYTVTAEYNEDANIPEEAELIAEQITVDSDEEHYAKREAEYRKSTGDKNAVMKALFKVGFYVDGEEVEPETAVKLTIQFFDENGLPEGTPITVVHFAEKGTEVLDGSEAESGSTSFEMESFSDVAIGFKKADAKKASVTVSESFQYKDEAFQITFHVKGEAGFAEIDSKEELKRRSVAEDNSAENAENGADESNGLVTEEKEEDAESEGSEIEEDSADGESTGSNEESGSETESEVISGSDPDFQLQLNTLSEKSEAYEMVDEYAKKKGELGELLQMQVLSYSLSYENRELDLSDCDVTVEIIPGEKLAARVEEISNNENDQRSVTLTTYELTEDTVKKTEDKCITDDTLNEPVVCALKNSRMAVRSNIVDDPQFTVQYYAYLQIAETGGDIKNSIELIDTSAKSNDGKVKLPDNKNAPKTMRLQTEPIGSGGDIGDGVIYGINYGEPKLREIYSQRSYNLMNYPELGNVNKFAVDDPHYQVESVWEWLGKSGADVNGVKENDWKIYRNLQDLRFTNNPQEKEKDPNNTILMGTNTIIRLVANSQTGSYNNDAAFYDYDITDGKVYSDKELTKLGDRTSDEVLYAKTNRQGINSVSNYRSNQSPRYGFGNGDKNTGGTGISNDKFNDYHINQANLQSKGNCSFGIVGGSLASNGTSVYPNFNVDAPKLFGSGETVPEGETAVEGYSLDFIRNGDTYTLSAVGGSNTKDLEKFQGRANWNNTQFLWTNNFWPMDSSKNTYGTDGHDLVFGDANKADKRKAIGDYGEVNFPDGDDGKDHNSYFGMNFAVDFELTDDYLGPLNYYFFGDDDMWVYLCPLKDDNSMDVENSKLVCDIGGVHSSVGEYVDLRDYLPNGRAGKYALVFFYTERGASGSTCWMQFTLPSVNTRPITQDTGSLKNTLTVSKTVDGPVPDGQQFEFEIEFKDEKGVDRYNCYAYKIVETDSDPEIEVTSGTIKTGGSFYLEKGQSIIVRNLPDKTTYTIREKDYNGYRPEITGTGEVVGGGETNGEINWDDDKYQDVSYVNVYCYELPETGGSGPIIYTMAGVLAIIFGAGFMYRKKVRERRV